MTNSTVWELPPAPPTLATDAVHAWRARLDLDATQIDAMARLLTDDEHARAARFRLPRDQRRFVVARGRLRLLLSVYLDQAPQAIVFEYGPQGKPEMPSLQFNVSHAGETVLYVFARSRRVGVDVEPLRALSDADRIVDRFFSAHEVAAYRALPDAERPDAFVTCWTRKEAFIKALGEGLSHPLDAFDVSVRPDEPATLLASRTDPDATARWGMEALHVGAGYAATVVAEHPPWHLACFDAASVDALSAAEPRCAA